MRPLISVDTEATGLSYNQGELHSFGMVLIEPEFRYKHYSGIIEPASSNFNSECYKAIGSSRKQHLEEANLFHYTAAYNLSLFVEELQDVTQALEFNLITDNPGFDMMWISNLCHSYLNSNPFGHSARRISDFYAGLRQRPFETSGWKSFRKTPHTHNALDDALGNAEAFIAITEKYGNEKLRKAMDKYYAKLFKSVEKSI